MQIQKFEFEPLGKKIASPDASSLESSTAKVEEVTPEEVQQAEEIPKQAEEALPAPPVISEEEIAAYKQTAYQEGYQKGVEATEKEQDAVHKHMEAILEQINMQLALVTSHSQETVLKLNQDLMTMVIAIARKVAGEAFKDNAAAEVERIIQEALTFLYQEPRLTLSVHPSVRETIAEKINTLLRHSGSKAEVTITALPEDAPVTECQVEWEDGSLRADKEMLWQHIESLLATYGNVKS